MSKKFLIPIVVLLLSLTSCTETIVERYSADNWKIIDVDIPYNSWTCYTDQYGRPYYEANVHVPEITSFVYSDGFVLCYLIENNSQKPLPYVRHYKNAKGESWTTTIDFEYNVGYLHVFYTNSDFNYLEGEPDFTKLRLVLQW